MKLLELLTRAQTVYGLSPAERAAILVAWLGDTEDTLGLAQYLADVAQAMGRAFVPQPTAGPAVAALASEAEAFFDLEIDRSILPACKDTGQLQPQETGVFRLELTPFEQQTLAQTLAGQIKNDDKLQPTLAVKGTFPDGDTFALLAYGLPTPYLDAFVVYGDHRFPYHTCPSHKPVTQNQPFVFVYPDTTQRTVYVV